MSAVGGWGELPEEMKHLPRVSASKLTALFDSPRKFHREYVLGKKKTTPAMVAGSLIHMAILEPERYAATYVEPPKPEQFPGRRILYTTQDLKEELKTLNLPTSAPVKKDLVARLLGDPRHDQNILVWDNVLLEAQEGGKTMITEADGEMVREAKAAVLAHPWASQALIGGQFEQLGWIVHDRTKVIITFRMDYYLAEMGRSKIPVVLDLKKVRSCHPGKFQSMLASENKFIQASVYVDAVKALTGKTPVFAWVGVEGGEPYTCEVYSADVGLLELGRLAYEKTIDRYLECLETNTWPGYSNGEVINVSLPSWKFREIDEQFESEGDI